MKILSHGLRLVLASTTVLPIAALAAAPIVGGNPVQSYDDAPYLAQFVKDSAGEVWCGGTVIDESWILSAGHCVSVTKSKKFKLYVGTLGVGKKGANAVKLDIDQAFVHPNYRETSSSVHYDYMLVHLKQPINFSKTGVRPAALPSADFINRGNQNPGVMATTMGWGALEEGGSEPSELMGVDVPLVDVQSAKKAYPDYDQTMIAAGYDAGGKDSCNGDSGGPLVTKDSVTGADTLIGVVSFGEGCARAGYYGIYSRVSEALPWIEATMKANR